MVKFVSPGWATGCVVLAACLGLMTCSYFKKEDPLTREQRKAHALLQGTATQFYKGSKVTLRSFIYMADSVGHSDKLLPAPHMRFFITNMLGMAAGNESSFPSAGAVASAMTEAYDLKARLKEIDEDTYPTILENILFLYDSGSRFVPWTAYTSEDEHLLLLALWLGSRKAPTEFQVYEAYAVHPEQAVSVTAAMAGFLGRALVFYDREWYYMSEQACDQYLQRLEHADKREFDFAVFPEAVSHTPEANYHQLHGAGLLMRSLNRREMEREEDMLQDMEGFLDDMEKGGVNNETVWLIGSYVSLHRENPEKAIEYLTLLKQSPIFSTEEKAVIQQIIDYVAQRDQDKALLAIQDRWFMARILYYYIKHTIQNNPKVAALREHKHARKMIEFTTHLDSVSQIYAPAAGLDSLGNTVKEGVKKWLP